MKKRARVCVNVRYNVSFGGFFIFSFLAKKAHHTKRMVLNQGETKKKVQKGPKNIAKKRRKGCNKTPTREPSSQKK